MTQQLSTLSSNGELTDDELTQAVGEVLKEYPFSCELAWFLDSSSVEYEPTILALRSAIAADRQRRKLLMPVEGEVSMEQTSTVQPQVGYWLPIETAPRDGTAILAICKHDADPYTEDGECWLTAYGAWCEGGRHVSDGPNVIAWGGGYSLGGTDCPQETMPDWWFQVEGDTLGEAAACPICWTPIPAYHDRRGNHSPGATEVVSPPEGEVTGVMDAIADCLQADAPSSTILDRIAALLTHHDAPVPVSDRPWEREGWCDMDGECWWCPPDGPVYWSMVNPAMVYGGWLLPHWAIHQPPQGGEVQP